MNLIPPRILHIIGSRPQGGVGSVLLNYYRNIDKTKIQFDFILHATSENGLFDEQVKSLGANVYIFPRLSIKNSIKCFSEYLRFFCKNKDYLAVHLHSVNIAFMVFPLARYYGIQHAIAHSHATKYSDHKTRSLRNFILCLGLTKYATILFACSKAAAAFLFGENTAKCGKVYIMNNAIDCDHFKYDKDIRHQVRTKLGIDDKLVVGHVGRFAPQKNHSFLVTIFAEFAKTNKNSVLLLVGPLNELSSEISSQVETLGLSKQVLFLGTRTDVNELFQAMDAFVLPSFFEGLPLVAIEAQASGLPCVLSDSVTREAAITKNVTYLSLSEKASLWSETISLSIHNGRREGTHESNRLVGYDICEEANKLETFYSSLILKSK
ncbi:MAG TPA: glycosyltransferase family 1 protein [Bdellovibrionales bacterium]|nr:MAG: hypothetical protein A2Z97_12855 [Bdellovibrionales bacterium GWB1_52_6]OFZ02828.1 MAG: hypothetical protein A2X97_04445 [Bdellovibrionales bacterium GWA1_52_35]OFZ33498.1 MAG: hypothetical protein A2070_14820 [Bdellovibrionales bacterium GWC1_52_8]HAR43211.1 glycosyltransferase family 1 protein [Bdellovibrionales bacterium]HCM38410.1 glycosyltransferase family 1 protein [Bdellovibrionales bacterium]